MHEQEETIVTLNEVQHLVRGGTIARIVQHNTNERVGQLRADLFGEIVDTVSSAATELEASANTLTKAAERSQSLAP